MTWNPTPGPWRTEGVSDAVRVVIGTGRQKIILARLRPPQLSENETWDNARLMAAAPELHDALKMFLECSPCRNGCKADDITCANNRAKAALEKAHGQAAKKPKERKTCPCHPPPGVQRTCALHYYLCADESCECNCDSDESKGSSQAQKR